MATNSFKARTGIVTTYISGSGNANFSGDINTSNTITANLAIIDSDLRVGNNISASGDIEVTAVSASYIYFPNNEYIIDSDNSSKLIFTPPMGNNNFAFQLRDADAQFEVESYQVGNLDKGARLLLKNGYVTHTEGKSFGTLEFGNSSYSPAQIRGTAIQDHGVSSNLGTSLDFYTTPSGSTTPIKTATFNTSSQFHNTGSLNYPSLIIGDPTIDNNGLVNSGAPAMGLYVSQSPSTTFISSNISVYNNYDNRWEDRIRLRRTASYSTLRGNWVIGDDLAFAENDGEYKATSPIISKRPGVDDTLQVSNNLYVVNDIEADNIAKFSVDIDDETPTEILNYSTASFHSAHIDYTLLGQLGLIDLHRGRVGTLKIKSPGGISTNPNNWIRYMDTHTEEFLPSNRNPSYFSASIDGSTVSIYIISASGYEIKGNISKF